MVGGGLPVKDSKKRGQHDRSSQCIFAAKKRERVLNTTIIQVITKSIFRLICLRISTHYLFPKRTAESSTQ